jgi:peptide/nickel transport system substrate-binding protein
MGRLKPAVLAPLVCLLGCAEEPRPFILALGSAPVSLDPHLTNESAAFSVNSNIYDSLLEADANLALRPALAVRWVNPDDWTLSFELRRGVRFQDGSPLDAEDVVASLLRARDDPRSEWTMGLREVASIEAASSHEVVLRTKRPFPALLRYLVPIAIVPAERVRGRTPLDRAPVGSGPYRYAGRDRSGAIELVAYDGHWRGRPGIERLRVRAIADDRERLRALGAGAVDMATDIPAAGVAELRTLSGVRLLRATGLRETYLAFDVSREATPYATPRGNPFLDRRVRVAFLHAVDRERLLGEVLQGFGQVATQFGAPGVFGFDPDIRPAPHDPSLSRRLLAEAGYASGFKVTLDAPSGVHPGDAEAARGVAADLRSVGLDVQLNLLPKPAMFDKLSRRDTTLFIGTWNSLTGDMEEIYLSLLRTRDPASGHGADNYGGYSNPAVDAAFDAAGAMTQPSARLARLKQGVALALADVPWVPLYVQDQLYGLREPWEWAPRPDKRVRASEIRRR